MSGALPTPRPSMLSLSIDAYRWTFHGFAAFLPTFLPFLLVYFIACVIAYNIDPRMVGGNLADEDFPFWVKFLSPSYLIDLLFVPCAIWWHRYVWSAETKSIWKESLSRKFGFYAGLTIFNMIVAELLVQLLDLVPFDTNDLITLLAGLGVVCFALVAFLVFPSLLIPFFVSLAIGFDQPIIPVWRRLVRNLGYCIGVSLLVFVPVAVVALVQLGLETLIEANRVVSEILHFFYAVIFSVAWISAATLIFKWLVDATRPALDIKST